MVTSCELLSVTVVHGPRLWPSTCKIRPMTLTKKEGDDAAQILPSAGERVQSDLLGTVLG